MNFEQIIQSVKQEPKKRIAVAAAHDIDVLEAVSKAMELGLVDPILVGDKQIIEALAKEHKLDFSQAKIIDVKDLIECAQTAVKLVRNGEADVLMKGLLQTADLLRAVLNKEWGLSKGGLISHVGIVETRDKEKLIFITDGAMVTYPDLKQKVDLINNSVKAVRALGIDCPKVAVIAAVEIINANMPATLDAAALVQMNRRGQIKNCIVDGPLALDLAVSEAAVAHKGVVSDVAGKADIMVMPNIESGNVAFKACTQIGKCECAGMIIGAAAPIVLTSRSDTAKSKLHSIACALKAAK